MTELMGLNNSPTTGSAASNVTNMGTNVGFYKEKLEEYSEGTDMSIDDVIIGITEAQGKIRAEMMRANSSDTGTAQPSVLVTDDRNMRVKATVKRVPALSGSAVRQILLPQNPKVQATRMRKKSTTPTITPPLESLRQNFPDLTDEALMNAFKEAGNDLELAEMICTGITANATKPSSMKRRPKKVAGAG